MHYKPSHPLLIYTEHQLLWAHIHKPSHPLLIIPYTAEVSQARALSDHEVPILLYDYEQCALYIMPRKKSSALDIAAAVGLTCVIQPLMNALTNFMLVPSHWLRLHSALTSFSFQIPKPHLPFRLASPGRCLFQWKSILSRVLDGKPLAVHVYDDNKNDVIVNTRGLHPWTTKVVLKWPFHAGLLGITLEITVPIMGALHITYLPSIYASALDGGKRGDLCEKLSQEVS